MKKHREQSGESAAVYGDLDALVLAEIESLHRRGRGRTRPMPSTGVEDLPATEPASAAGVAQIRGTESEGEVFSGEEAAGLFDESIGESTELGELEQDGHAAVDGLYSAEEDAFITRAVGFLTQRDNADVILNQIWQQVMEGYSEEFYRAPDTPLPVPPGESVTGSAGGETHNAAAHAPDGNNDSLDVGSENND